MSEGQVLVTGAGGWVGSSLVRRLAQAGFRIRAASRRTLEPMPTGTLGPVTHLPGLELAATASWARALEGVDVVVHCAARVHVLDDRSADPLRAFRQVNAEGTEALARQSAQAGVRRFVFLSSAHVNGTQGSCSRPFTESDPPQPDTPYGISKWEAEQALHRLAQDSKMEVVVLRPPLVVGAGVGGNLHSLMHAILRGLPMPLASIENRRSMIGLSDLVDAIQTCITHPLAARRTWLVADPLELSTPDLVRGLARHLNRPARLVPMPVSVLAAIGGLTGRSGSVRSLCGCLRLDSAALSSTLGWHPRVGIDASLGEAATRLLAMGAR